MHKVNNISQMQRCFKEVLQREDSISDNSFTKYNVHNFKQ